MPFGLVHSMHTKRSKSVFFPHVSLQLDLYPYLVQYVPSIVYPTLNTSNSCMVCNPSQRSACIAGQWGSSIWVVLKETATMKTHVASMKGKFAASKSKTNSQVTYDYDFMNGYSAKLDNDSLKDLTQSPDVEMIIPDTLVYPTTAILVQYVKVGSSITHTLTICLRNDAPWGLARVSSRVKLPEGSSAGSLNYTFERKPSPAGVDVYILDTGVNIHHTDFQGRARWGKTFGTDGDNDLHGHGTHVAGTVAGKRWGVAKAASIVAVKVLSDRGPGPTSNIIAGVTWAVAEARRTGRPSVINMSLGGSANDALDRAVTKAVAAGVHVVVAAGNDNVDASGTSPARAESVITVGASNITDQRWVSSNTSGSNFGSSVDIFAPGQRIMSAATNTTMNAIAKTGTSMAAPHVAGLIAYLLATEGRRTPQNMLARVKQLAPDGVLKGLPSDTRNEIIWNGQ
ncbi:serine protease [Rhizoctonia solani AG-1 IA]|uniref:Serine protease n=1 Tax=Thanatephorus cucumeris (strain AG1-IA) TaxID=983506 RepID=L8WJZ8_THACA|nr:serine protease [Rhizoctonia solani AG-1 IA]